MARRTARPFAAHYVVGVAEACWPWTGFLTRDGYGQYGGRKAHRLSYELAVGPIPPGLTLDHLCRNRACVNPAHLDPVTHAENMRRGQAPSIVGAARATCRNGHPRSKENVYVPPSGDGRICRICNREAVARLKRRRKEGR